MKLFIASTPYNLFNCINIKYHLFPNDDADIIISNFDSKNFKYFNNLRTKMLFKNVYFIEQKKFNENDFINNRLIKLIKKTFAEINNRYFYNNYFKRYCLNMNSKTKYDEMYVDGFGFMPRFIFNHYKKNNKDIKVYKVDCGIESYYDAYENNKITKKQKFICNKMRKKLVGCYLYDYKIANVGKYKVELIPKVKFDDVEFRNLINYIFDYEKDYSINKNKHFIFLDQELSDCEALENIENNIVNVLNENVKENYLVKLHPRTDTNISRYKDVEKIKTNSTFEILCLNDSYINDMTIITPYSSAAALPKIVFDKEPRIICLTNLFNNLYIESLLTTTFFEKLKSIYLDKEKVIIPENLEEFSKIIKELKNNK